MLIAFRQDYKENYLSVLGNNFKGQLHGDFHYGSKDTINKQILE